jgi:hypothetical protein
METVGLGLYFEDLPVGRQFKTIGRTVTEADITNFVNCTGMVEVLFTPKRRPRNRLAALRDPSGGGYSSQPTLARCKPGF